jgi:hypothetical protein
MWLYFAITLIAAIGVIITELSLPDVENRTR